MVQAVHSVAVVEEHSGSSGLINQESVKPPVQTAREESIFLIEVDEIRWAAKVQCMPSLPQTAVCIRPWKLLTGEKQNHRASFIADGHLTGKGVQ